jgi:hypothetical protein
MPELIGGGQGSATLMHKVDEDKYVIQNVHDDSGAQALVKALNQDGLSGKNDGMRLERVIPQHVLDRSFAEGWFNDNAAWKRWANSPEGRLYGVEYNGKVKTL